MEYKEIDFSDSFIKLSSLDLENICSGRKGGILVDVKNNQIPVVRSTTMYYNASDNFTNIHYELIDCIKSNWNFPIEFNNAMIEIYNDSYKSMKYHSDQMLDLADNSYICIFSCYKYPENNKRILKIKNKFTGDIYDIKMNHNSIILFSTETNKMYHHKIILEQSGSPNEWLGITFRLSKTFITRDNKLTLATDEERQLFYKMRKDENNSIDYHYPAINYTISPSDLLEPI